MDLEFTGEVVYWRGPSPFYFVVVPEDESSAIESASRLVSYGWGCIPVAAQIGATSFTTSLFPKDGGYLVPLKVAVRKKVPVEEGDTVAIRLTLDC
jgi:hypothetical protein